MGNLKTKQKQCSLKYYFQEKFFLLLSMTMLKKVTFFQFKLIFFDIRHQCFAWNKTRKSLDVFPQKKLWWSLGNITYRFVDNHIYREHFIGSFWLRLSQLLSILQFHLGGQVFQWLQKTSVEEAVHCTMYLECSFVMMWRLLILSKMTTISIIGKNFPFKMIVRGSAFAIFSISFCRIQQWIWHNFSC